MAAFKDRKNDVVCSVPLHGLAGRTAAEAETRLCHQTRGFGVGARVPYAEKVRPEYDVRELLQDV